MEYSKLQNLIRILQEEYFPSLDKRCNKADSAFKKALDNGEKIYTEALKTSKDNLPDEIQMLGQLLASFKGVQTLTLEISDY